MHSPTLWLGGHAIENLTLPLRIIFLVNEFPRNVYLELIATVVRAMLSSGSDGSTCARMHTWMRGHAWLGYVAFGAHHKLDA